MPDEVYKELCQTMTKRGGRYPGRDIPEFYALVEVLFTPEEAAFSNAMPRGFFTAAQLAEALGRDEASTEAFLESMADKWLCVAGEMGGTRFYSSAPFVPGIFEFQFMSGGTSDRDRLLARLIHAYKAAFDAEAGQPRITYPGERVIPVDRKIKAGNKVHTYQQVAAYIEKYDPISVATCFCRHEAELIDPEDTCGKPNDVCMQFGMAAQFAIDRKLGRRVGKEEANEILKRAEEAGLVHCTLNEQEITFLCNCCADHCMILKTALAQPKPGLILQSGFRPEFDADLCTACETCVDNCPGSALTMGEDDLPAADWDRCFGCGVCATLCPAEAVTMGERPGIDDVPADRKELKARIKASRA
ncbi:MAG: 4Fe-4S binding protein [Proteobacteria bacterium]|nr:4Fe-4S binding protein [Pseudomonadota bacterium]